MIKRGKTEDPLHLRVGEVVRVRSEAEIRSTLDEKGLYEGIPFMPEMRRYCDGVFRVYKRSDKVCSEHDALRHMRDTVLLEGIRCDGAAHGGCERSCFMFWKEAWLQRAGAQPLTPHPEWPSAEARKALLEPIIPEAVYHCQATALYDATTPLPIWQVGQYVRDLRAGQFSILTYARILAIVLYNRAARLLRRPSYWTLLGSLKKTPEDSIGLQPGEMAQMKSADEILATLDSKGCNRGLQFSPEMRQFCGGVFRVLRRASRMIVETNGRMCAMKNTVLLENVLCDGTCHRGCARSSYLLCREIWLRRASQPQESPSSAEPMETSVPAGKPALSGNRQMAATRRT